MTEKDLLLAKLKYIKYNQKIIQSNQEIISLYHAYIYKIVELFDYLIRNEDDLFYTIFFSKLLNSGFFSLNSRINKSIKKKQEITTNFGINVLTGKCCCRNIADFYQDIFSHFYFYPLLLTCLEDAKIKNQTEITFGNHQVNLTKYHDSTYLFDLTNNLLYYPISPKIFISFNNRFSLYWRKYTDIIFRFYKETSLKHNFYEEIIIKELLFKESINKDLISKDAYQKLKDKAYELMNEKDSILRSFYQDTYHFKEEIDHLLIKK